MDGTEGLGEHINQGDQSLRAGGLAAAAHG